ncbi:MAG: TerB N-terminal domain-containing protein [Clostridia bacterium]|nr:TerB N-terminal domain-containing protein [Clostridia bacterium]
MKCYLPEKYVEMKNLAANFNFYSNTEGEIFYKQAKLMEHFEDDFDYDGIFARSFPTYRLMNDQQLRGYFSFRTKVRRGDIKKSCTSFAYVYCYELLHGIGVADAADGYNKLLEFCKTYSAIDTMFGDCYIQWLNDYVVYNNLDKNLLKNISSSDFDESLGVISNPFNVDDEKLFAALDSLSAYHYHSSKAYKTAPDDMKLLTCNVFRAVMEYYNKNRQKGFIETAFGRIMSGPYIMFKAAIFYDYKKYSHYSYKISETLSYSCKQGHWSRERFFGYRSENKELGNLFKNIDAAYRSFLGVKPVIKRVVENKIYTNIIQNEIIKLNEIKKQRQFDSVKIDFSKLSEIRVASEATRDKLIVDDEPEENIDVVAFTEPIINEAEKQTNQSTTEKLGLDETALLFLTALLKGEEYIAELKNRGIMVSVLADRINDSLFELFGDTVIEFDGDSPSVIEDYADELKGMLNL